MNRSARHPEPESSFEHQLRKTVRNRMLPHLLALFQWTLLVISLILNLNSSVAVTGATASGGLKAIMLFHLWLLLLPIVSFLLFYRTRKEGKEEKCIVGLSMATLSLSIANVSLHYVDELVLLMKATEVVSWTLYNSMLSVSLYKTASVFLLPILRRLAFSGGKKLWAQG